MNALNVQNLHKSFGTRTVFAGVSFALDPGEKVGLIGANGSGKTTLLRILAGIEGHEQGILAFQRGIRVGYLAQEPSFAEDETIREAVASGHPELQAAFAAYHEAGERLADSTDRDRWLARQSEAAARIEALGGWDWEHRVETILTRLGVGGWERQVAGLSGGEQKRVALARTLLARPELLLLDEPTNHLDADTTQWLEEHLQEYPGALLLITHDRYFLDRVVTRMLEVSIGELTSYPGGYTEYLEAKAERLERERAEEGKRAKLIEQELAWVRRSPSARTGKQQARINRLGDLQAEQRQACADSPATLAELQAGERPRLGRTVLELHGISKSYGERVLIRGLSTALRAGERIGVIGPNGAGKTTLLRIILGLEPPDAGEVEVGRNTRIAYYDQRREELDPEVSVYETASNQDFVTVGGERMHLRSYLESFLFPVPVQRQKVSSLSGGERNRLLLARLLLQDANLLILDEPTNDLDLVTLQVLESFLASFPGCLLLVTHDRFFLDKVATGLLVFEGEGVVHRHEGGYELYRRLREQREAERASREEAAPGRGRGAAPAAQPVRSGGGARRLTWREKQELQGIEESILEAEALREELGARLADPSLYTGAPEEVARLTSDYRAAVEQVDALYARWAELEEIRSAG
ncbi:MAG: ABC-F family ATP-binding cassette domain-containing protein [Gemmatimonadota bacterium]|nr:ABC-F family ATP-binding cassette domain-containing protein [Gemmatimonadota bacterium]